LTLAYFYCSTVLSGPFFWLKGNAKIVLVFKNAAVPATVNKRGY